MKIDKEFYPKIVDHPLSSTAVYPTPLVFGIRSAFPMLPRPSRLLLTVSYGDQARVIVPAKTSNDTAWLAWHLYVFSKNHQALHNEKASKLVSAKNLECKDASKSPHKHLPHTDCLTMRPLCGCGREGSVDTTLNQIRALATPFVFKLTTLVFPQA